MYYLYKMLFHSNKGISPCDIIKVDIICTCRNRNVAAATRSDKSTLTLIVLTFSKTPVSIIAPLVISTNLQATSRNLLLGKIPLVRSHLLQVDVITFISLATYTYQTNILKLCRILVGKFCPLISHGREVGCECIVSILLLANVTSLITNSSSNSPFLCKDTTFPRNFQGFREKILEKGVEKKKIGDSRIGGESPIL